MNVKIIFEVLLKSYKDLEALSNNCDNNILGWALNSNIDIFNGVENINKNIIEKTAYCNIKVIFDEAIKRIGHCDELKYKYFQGLKFKNLDNINEYQKYEKDGKEIEYKNPQNAFEVKARNQKRKLYSYLIRNYSIEKLFNLIKDSNILMYRYYILLKKEKQKF